ncbi:MAG: ABC transporter ATP-binding protein [Clostridia bacterium]|nr:ABC transporter ATP-binding protein [Clostridia bacterium]
MLEAIQLSKSFDGRPVLVNVSLRLKKGGHYCLMGASGSGKTTLVNLFLGLIRPDSGSIRRAPDLRMSAVFQEDRLLEQMTAAANVALVSKAPGSEIERLLLRLGIAPESLPQPVSTYSGGMKRRVALARALLSCYDVLFLDEPYKGLDAQTRALAMQIVCEYTKEKTVLLITHDPAEAEGYIPLQLK